MAPHPDVAEIRGYSPGLQPDVSDPRIRFRCQTDRHAVQHGSQAALFQAVTQVCGANPVTHENGGSG